jgi:hypothetical protein
MWELPVYIPSATPSATRSANPSAKAAAGDSPEFTLRHAITVTNHVVDVYVRSGAARGLEGAWVPVNELSQRALTGLTRKALRRVGCMP